ncbi:MAG: protein-L-isoaspartate O-methyltransferase [Gammaproteobacteria bacterium]|nr:protein-L-isoaspartate O-methyltransferase [Gammaproteobacteria bacterium]
MNFKQARFNMVEQQVRPWNVLDPAALAVMSEVPRENFVAPAYKTLAYGDYGVPIGNNQEMLKPVLVGRLLQALSIQPDEIVLEVGTGTGYLTACLAKLSAYVYSVDINADFLPEAKKNLTSLQIDNVSLQTGDASAGWAERPLYDVIVITASMPEVPDCYKTSLEIGGRLFVVTGASPVMHAKLITRVAEDVWSDENIFETDLPALENTRLKASFSF